MSVDEKVADYLGEALPIGTPVTYWPGVREGDGIKSVTRSNVWDLGGTPVVMVRGAAGGIALTHIALRELDDADPTDPDLTERTPEQEFAAHIADLLTDVDHFAGCGAHTTGDNDYCTCIRGRLYWAALPESIPPRPEPTAAAIDVLAREVTEQMLDPMDLGDLWSDYPELGEDDWRDVVARVRDRAEAAKPDVDTYKTAYAHLQGRAEAWTAENDPA